MKDYIALLDTPGGHMLACLLLVVLGLAAFRYIDNNLGSTMVLGATGVLFGAMKGQNGSKMRLEPRPDRPWPPDQQTAPTVKNPAE